MDKKSRELGAILLTNLVLNSETLSRLANKRVDSFCANVFFEKLDPKNLYARLLTNVDFEKLSGDEKRKYLFADRDANVDDKGFQRKVTKEFVKEAHKRTCDVLGVDTTRIVYLDFKDNSELDPNYCSVYDYSNGNIYINSGLDFSQKSPSYFLEELNTRTRSHAIHKNIMTAIKDPEALSDNDYFVALMTALKHYVYEYAKRDFDKSLTMGILSFDYATPEAVDSVIYGFSQTKRQLKLSGLYGGETKDKLRTAEKYMYDLLQSELLDTMLCGHEDMIDNFVVSPLNEQSGGLLGTILKGLEVQLASGYFNSLGANMKKGQDVTAYIDQLQREHLEHLGKDEDEIEQLMNVSMLQNDMSEDGLDEEFEEEPYEEEYEELEESEFDNEEYEELEESEFDNEEFDEEPFNPFRNVLPKDEKEDNVSGLFGTKKNEQKEKGEE